MTKAEKIKLRKAIELLANNKWNEEYGYMCSHCYFSETPTNPNPKIGDWNE